MTKGSRPSWAVILLGLIVAIVLAIGLSLALYRPDRPVATIAPGSSSGPSFVVQMIRPRLGLPLGGIVPPQVFGQEAHLGFASTSEGARVVVVGPGRIELGADGWDLVLAFDGKGVVTAATQIVFELEFEGRKRRVRCRPGSAAAGQLNIASSIGAGGPSGSFDIELARCEDVESGQSLGWPPKPFILHGSFDQLVVGAKLE